MVVRISSRIRSFNAWIRSFNLRNNPCLWQPLPPPNRLHLLPIKTIYTFYKRKNILHFTRFLISISRLSISFSWLDEKGLTGMAAAASNLFRSIRSTMFLTNPFWGVDGGGGDIFQITDKKTRKRAKKSRVGLNNYRWGHELTQTFGFLGFAQTSLSPI